jgi:hypothetical protein
MTAIVAHERGFRDIVLYDQTCRLDLGPDTLRNHAWLQSGLLYAMRSGPVNRAVALRMHDAGISMVERFLGRRPNRGFSPGEQLKGLFRLSSEENAKHFEERAAELRVRVRRVTAREASRQTLLFDREQSVCYEVPDRPFDEAAVLREAVLEATQDRKIHCIAEKAHLKRSGKKLSINVGTEVISPALTILCAGCALPGILNDLQLTHPLMIRRSCLMRVPWEGALLAPLLVDLDTEDGMSIVRHSPPGCLLIGSKRSQSLDPNRAGERIVSPEVARDLRRLLPPELAMYADVSPDSVRFTAGHKTEIQADHHGPSVEPWVTDFADQGLPDLWAAVPGKATVAFTHAGAIIDTILKKGKSRTGLVRNKPKGLEMKADRKSHYDSSFNGLLNEAQHDGDEDQES